MHFHSATRAWFDISMRKHLTRVGGIVGTLMSVGLVAWVVHDASDATRSVRINLGVAAGAGVLALVAWATFGLCWLSLLGRSDRLEVMSTWTKSQALRYIPGSIWGPLARSQSVPGRVRSKAATVIAEALLQLATATGVGGLLLALSGSPVYAALLLAPPAACAAIWLIGRGQPIASAQRILRVLALYTFGWVSYAGAALLAQMAVGPTNDPWRAAGSACLAWAAGFVVVFAPAGVGARELAYVALMHGHLGSARASAGAIVDRLLMVLAEMLTLVVTLTARRTLRRRTRKTDLVSP
jgi:glycosyltransferase 2 family protein